MPVKPQTHKPGRPVTKRHLAPDTAGSKTRKDFTNAAGYGYKWRKESKAYLVANPLCVDCEARGRVRLASQVDHIVPHRGDMDLFWRRSNWASRCHGCHSAKTARGQ